MNFVPKVEWSDQLFTLNDLRNLYFSKRNGPARRFDFKLYNALLITEKFPSAYYYIGAIWVMPNVFKIHSRIFGSLLGIHAIQGGLFHQQGNFVRHGFIQISKNSNSVLSTSPECIDVDDYDIRLFSDSEERLKKPELK